MPVCLKIVIGMDGVFARGHADQLTANSPKIAGRRELQKSADIGRLFVLFQQIPCLGNLLLLDIVCERHAGFLLESGAKIGYGVVETSSHNGSCQLFIDMCTDVAVCLKCQHFFIRYAAHGLDLICVLHGELKEKAGHSLFWNVSEVSSRVPRDIADINHSMQEESTWQKRNA